MTDAIVQLLRNALCCVKDLGLFKDSFASIYDAKVLQQFYEAPEPFNKTTPLDLMIAVTQFYATVSLCSSGWKLFNTSYGKFARVQRILDSRLKQNGKKATQPSDDADRLINVSLVKEAMYSIRSMFIGVMVFSIGCAFFWLAGNSVHLTETGWIGGLPAVIHALTVAEIGLAPLLYYMWKDSREQIKKAARVEELARKLNEAKTSSSSSGALKGTDIDLMSFEALTNWLPFWNSGVSIFEMKVPESAEEEKMVANEKQKIQKLLERYTGGEPSSSSDKKKDDKKKDDKKKDDNSKQAKLDVTLFQDKAKELLHTSKITRWEGHREMVFFVLNTIAFYAYMLCVVVYYFPDENRPIYVHMLCFGLDGKLADWHGNFWGDLMWTIEPMILLSSSYVFASLRSATPAKSKIKKE